MKGHGYSYFCSPGSEKNLNEVDGIVTDVSHLRIISRMTTTSPSSWVEPDFHLIAETIRSRISPGPQPIQFTSLPGDASNRRYFRAALGAGKPSSLIVMQLAGPEAFKASEEAVSDVHQEIKELPFINVLRFLRGLGVHVPTLHYYDETAGLLYLEDFGDRTLFHAIAHAGVAYLTRLYSQAIDTLVHIHLKAMNAPPSTCLAFVRAFDASLFMWEFDHFLEYGIVARCHSLIREKDELVIRKEFQKIADYLASQEQYFTHRDYHSRNLMVDGERLGVIDFQDALLGPVTYDLASLLRDSYVELDDTFLDSMLDRYLDRISQGLSPKRRQTMLLTDKSAFRRLFDLTSLQRNLKAAGRFVYIDHVKHNPKFLADVPRTLGYVRRNLEKYPELATLRAHLSPYVPEFQ